MTDMISRDAALSLPHRLSPSLDADDGYYVSVDALRAIPAVDPAAIREEALREARQRVNDLLAERQADFLGARNSFNRGSVDALQQACAIILALIGEKK